MPVPTYARARAPPPPPPSMSAGVQSASAGLELVQVEVAAALRVEQLELLLQRGAARPLVALRLELRAQRLQLPNVHLDSAVVRDARPGAERHALVVL